MKKIILMAAACFTLAGCADMNDTHQKFLDQGTRIYVGKADSLVVCSGNRRVEIQGLMHYAKTAEKCMIRWNIDGKADSVTVQSSNWVADNKMSVIINDLPVGIHRFFAQTYDAEGNVSLNVECNGSVYDEEYALTAQPKSITLMNPQPEGMYLSWNVPDDVVSAELKWETEDGEETMTVERAVRTTLLPSDWKTSGTIQTRSLVKPEPNAIDTFQTPWVSHTFPDFVEFAVDKTKIKHLPGTGEATTGHSGDIKGVFDGNVAGGGAQFHSGDGVGVPQHLTFDLGVNARIARWEIYARDDNYHNWNPKRIQIWGIEEMTEDSRVTLPSADAGWEDSARAKGWKLLTENDCTHPISNQLTITNPQKARYIIIRTLEVYGPPASGSGAYVILREVWFWADNIDYIDTKQDQ